MNQFCHNIAATRDVAEIIENDQSNGELLDLDEVDIISDAGLVTALPERMHAKLGGRRHHVTGDSGGDDSHR